MTPLWYGRVRVYFNAYNEAPLFWSVDNGDPRTEVKCCGVKIDYPVQSVVTAFVSVSEIQPRAWLEADQAIVSMLPNGMVEIS